MQLSGRLADQGLKPFRQEQFFMGHHKLPRIWIVVADNEKALMFRKSDRNLEKIGEARPNAVKAETEIANKNSGRMPNPFAGGGRHRLEEHDAATRYETHAFLQSLAHFINEAAQKNSFDRFMMIAAPKTLGVLRGQLSKVTRERLSAEMDKDLTHLDEHQLTRQLDKMLWF